MYECYETKTLKSAIFLSSSGAPCNLCTISVFHSQKKQIRLNTGAGPAHRTFLLPPNGPRQESEYITETPKQIHSVRPLSVKSTQSISYYLAQTNRTAVYLFR